MTCRTVFKIDISSLSVNSIEEIIDLIGVEPGITDSFLYYGMLKRDTTDDHYSLYEQLHDTLSIIYDKKEIIKKIPNMFPVYYYVDVKFSNIEEEIEKNTSFIIADDSKDFIEYVGAYYNLNDGYFLVDSN